MRMKYTIIVVTHNRETELFNCLNSISQCNSSYNHEVVIIFNGEKSYFKKCLDTYPHYNAFYLPKTTPAASRNYAIQKAKGEYLFFLDDDCILPKDYFSKINFHTNWDVIGGPDQTPPFSSPHQKTIGLVLSSPFCMGPTYKRHTRAKRYEKNTNEKSLILCNLWFKASIFKSEGYRFNTNLFRNEENFLLKQISNSLKIIHYDPNLYVFHQRKQDLQQLWNSVSKSGECRAKNFLLLPKYNELLYFLPVFWLVGLFLLFFWPHWIFLFIFSSYTFSIITYNAISNRSFNLQYIYLHFFILTAYSFGITRGLFYCIPNWVVNIKKFAISSWK